MTDAAVLTIRPMRWWDIEPLLGLERELFGDEAWTAGMFWSELAHADSRWYVVAEDAAGELVGYAGLCAYPGETYVQTLGVTASAQGSGLGTRLLTELLEEAIRRGESVVSLEVRADNERAQALYRKFGFLPVGRRKGYYQPSGTDAVVMQLPDVDGHLAALRKAGSR
jgi:ribosomal-protein-alanine N-acetyltransferase